MARLFIFGIGGTGSRVIKSLTMLLASGMKPGNFDTVIPILIDPHKDLKELNECKKLIRLYSKINESTYQETAFMREGFFRTKMTTLKSVTTDKTLKDDIEFDERHNEPFGDFINKPGIRQKSQSTLDLLSLLYSDKNFSQQLSVGFKGNPHMGSIVLNSIIGGPAYNAFKSTFAADDRIFIISSIFGGTGAAGFPLLLQNFRQSDNIHIRESYIGALSVMPYFKLSEPGQTSDIDSNDFMTKTKSALTYYTRSDFINLYDSMYYIADPYKQTDPYKNDEHKQENKAHIVELLGALSIFHFAKNKVNRGSVNEYCLSANEEKITFDSIGNSTKEDLGHNLTALHLLSILHPFVKAEAKSLTFCKSNDFNSNFFNDDFFTNSENGFEKFLSQYYNTWINEINDNQRGFSPFNLKSTTSFNSLVNGESYQSEKHIFDNIIMRPTDILDLVTQVSIFATKKELKQLNEPFKFCQYLSMCFQGTASFIDSKLKIKDNA
ncbi:hypothetical protein [Runella sp.]|uniref:hypothetical protein n=1 Tax=Runella sp. TaxID=1960881 RepID=UPI003D0C4BA5